MVVIFNEERSGARHAEKHSEELCFSNKKRIWEIIYVVLNDMRYPEEETLPVGHIHPGTSLPFMYDT